VRIAYGEWRPDLPPIINQQGLIQARNVLPKAGGYRPVLSLVNLTSATALTARPRGSVSGITASGNGFMFAGDATKLYQQTDTGMTDRTRTVGGGYVLGTDHRWSLVKFGESIFAATPNEDTQVYRMGSSTNFAQLSQNAPRARHLAVIGDFVMAGNIYDPVEGPQPASISWPAIRNPFLWPVVGSDEAVSVQSDRQPLEGDGGWVQDLIGGAEVGAVFQERAVWRLDYVGGGAIFRINRVESGVGMLVPDSAVAFERKIFYIAEDGFRIFDYTSSVNIGKERVNRTFLADLDSLYFDRVWIAKDPDETVIWIAYPGSGNTAGRPNKLIFYDYTLNRFSDAAFDLEALIQNATVTSPSLDAPTTAEDPADIDAPPQNTTSFDDRGAIAGATRMGAFDSAFIASDFSGSALEGLLETGDLELNPGGNAFLSEVRPLVDGKDARIAVATTRRRNETMLFGDYRTQDADGSIPFRADGRYHRLRTKLPPGWTEAVGMDLVTARGGRR
jgi:hypothetical protein